MHELAGRPRHEVLGGEQAKPAAPAAALPALRNAFGRPLKVPKRGGGGTGDSLSLKRYEQAAVVMQGLSLSAPLQVGGMGCAWRLRASLRTACYA